MAEVFRRVKFCSDEKEIDNDNRNLSYECYACTQVGVPVFHSSNWDLDQQPEWESSAGSSLVPIKNRTKRRNRKWQSRATAHRQSLGCLGRVLDSRSARLQRWNRVILQARGVALAVDPLFFFAMSIRWMVGSWQPWRSFAHSLTTMEVVHTWHLWLQFRVAYVSKESPVLGCGKLVWDARAVASQYLRSFAGFWLDAFAVLPLVLGGYWYILSVERITSCLARRCGSRENCIWTLSCVADACCPASKPECASSNLMRTQKPFCLDEEGYFSYGLYKLSLPLFSRNSVTTKILYSNLWGLMALSPNLLMSILMLMSFGFAFTTMGNNLEPTSQCAEVIFAILMVLAGLILFTLLIGNIQVFLHAIMVRRRQIQFRYRDIEWWMRHRQLPSHLKRRVRQYEHQRWEMMGGQDELELIRDLPEGLRRDIKRNLCLDLIKKVPLLSNLDNLILDNICDRVKPLVYCKDEKIIREGDPVQTMIFIDIGRIIRSQSLAKGMIALSMLEPGSFLGDELLSWCLRRPFLDRLPTSSATFTCVEPVEAYALGAEEFRYITDHFRSHFTNKRVKQMTRYYSSNWRTWAAVNIQFAWRRQEHWWIWKLFVGWKL